MIINDQLLISEVQKQFTETFPFLRVNFFRPVWNSSFIQLQPKIAAGERLINLKKTGQDGNFKISPQDKIALVEQNFRRQYALEALIMLRSGNNWLITNQKDNYTLEQQNALGIETPVEESK
jgi:hypothetical protein